MHSFLIISKEEYGKWFIALPPLLNLLLLTTIMNFSIKFLVEHRIIITVALNGVVSINSCSLPPLRSCQLVLFLPQPSQPSNQSSTSIELKLAREILVWLSSLHYLLLEQNVQFFLFYFIFTTLRRRMGASPMLIGLSVSSYVSSTPPQRARNANPIVTSLIIIIAKTQPSIVVSALSFPFYYQLLI